MTEEWGPWIEHDGMGCPVVGRYVRAVEVTGLAGRLDEYEGVAGSGGGRSWDWSNFPVCTKIIRYRVRKPKGLTILEELIREITPEKELVQ